jgi:hypothetical protein
MPLWGKPVLGHILEMLARWGVEDVLINLHHQPEAICDYVRRRPASSPRVSLSFEPDILGTGGVLRRASWFLDTHPFWMINADIAADVDPRALITAFQQPRVLAALWLNAQPQQRHHGQYRQHAHPGRPGQWATGNMGGVGVGAWHSKFYKVGASFAVAKIMQPSCGIVYRNLIAF